MEIQEDFTGALVLTGSGKRAGYLGQRKNSIHRDMEETSLKEIGKGGVGGLNLGGGSGFPPAAEPESLEDKVLKYQEAVRDFEGLATHGTEGDVRRARSEGICDIQGAGPTDGVEAQLGKPATTELARFAAEVGLLSDDNIRSEGEEFLQEFRTADNIQSAEAEMAGELDDSAADGGVCGVLDDPVAGLKRHEIVEKTPGGGGVHRQHCGLMDVEIVWEWDGVLGGKEEFTRPSAESERENFLADKEIFHPSTEGEDFAAAFVADRGGKRRELAIGALNDIQVGGVDRCGQHSNDNVAGTGSRR